MLGDRVQLQQVVLNLLLNGLDAAAGPGPGRRPGRRPGTARADRRRGTLTVRTRRRARRGARGAPARGGAVEVAVRDSGPGLDPAAAGRLFEPFYTTKPAGLGMGLAISRTIAEAHGGACGRPPPAGGAVFTLALPISRPARLLELRQPCLMEDAGDARGSRSVVYVVDDAHRRWALGVAAAGPARNWKAIGFLRRSDTST